MINGQYHVFGLGANADDLHYIGWTQRSLTEAAQIYTDLIGGAARDIASWVSEAGACGGLNIFEIEPVATAEAARSAATGLCCYFRSLGLDVVTDAAE